MNLYLRLVWLLVNFRFRRKLALLEDSSTAFRVWPLDLDVNLHMNNGRYLTLMDLARLDLMLRSGWAGKILKARMFPVVAGQAIRYRRSLDLFQRFEIVTTLLGWDEHAFYLQQRFVRKGETVALGVIRGVFLQKGRGRVRAAEVVAAAGEDLESPEIPQWVLDWHRSERDAWADEKRAAS